jgi:signal transduction histidine kinase
VKVRLTRKDDAVTIAVTDTGFGLTPEEAGKLFNEFTRIKNEHTVKVLGSGLGLSTVRKIADMYNGDASVQSEPGVGSTFTVVLRDAAARGAESAATTAAAPSA